MGDFDTEGKNYTVATFVLRTDGWWGVNYWGEHAEQGGISFTMSNMYSQDLEYMMKRVQKDLLKHKDLLAKLIEKREKE